MRLFNGYLNQAFELTEKQILLEYGDILVEGEIIEKAVKLGLDKWVLTSHRLFLVLSCKGGKYELLSIPYITIRKFSAIRTSSAEQGAELNIYLIDEPQPIRKRIKSLDLVNEISRILAKRIFNINKQSVERPLVKMN